MPTNGCPSGHLLHSWLVGRCGVWEVEAIAEHVEHCPDCERSVQALEENRDTLIGELCAVFSADTTDPDAVPGRILLAVSAGLFGRGPTVRGRFGPTGNEPDDWRGNGAATREMPSAERS